jgi:hypothetical protein
MNYPFNGHTLRSAAAKGGLDLAGKLDSLEIAIPPYDGPAIAAAKNLIATLRGGKPRNLAILGEAGIGKSTVATKVVSACRRFLGSEMHENTILELRLSSKASISSMAEDVLSLLGDEHFKRIDPAIAEKRIIAWLKGSRVKIVMIDEAHHLLHGKGVKGRYYLAESLKNIGDLANVIFIFVGTPELGDLVKENKQFARRLRTYLRLRPFDWADDDGQANLLRLLHAVDKALGFSTLAGLDVGDLPLRIYQAFSGVPGVTIEFLIEAAKAAYDRGKTKLELIDFQKIYHRDLASQRVGQHDPFAEDIPDNWKLVRPGFWFQDEGPKREGK